LLCALVSSSSWFSSKLFVLTPYRSLNGFRLPVKASLGRHVWEIEFDDGKETPGPAVVKLAPQKECGREVAALRLVEGAASGRSSCLEKPVDDGTLRKIARDLLTTLAGLAVRGTHFSSAAFSRSVSDGPLLYRSAAQGY
jgi:hypothetical protein